MLKEYNKIVLKRIQDLMKARKLYHGNEYVQHRINKELTVLYDIQYEIIRST